MKLHITALIGAATGFVILTCVNLALTLYVVENRQTPQPRVVTINAADLMLKAMAGVDPDITEEALATYVRGMNAELGSVVELLSAENNIIIINSASVLSGAPDITDTVLAVLQEVVQ